MSFERHKCRICERVCFCVDVRSLDLRKKAFRYAYWVCEYDLQYVLEPIKTEKQIEQIMIECGIEDIEKNVINL